MLLDLNDLPPDQELSADVCIVGAGAVGLALATDLARKGIKVVVLESGGKTLENDSQKLSEGFSTGRTFNHVDVGRYRVLGGSTTFWGGQVSIFDQVVFENRPWVHTNGWPFGREKILPYYDRAFSALGLSSVIKSDADVWRKAGLSTPDLGDKLELVLSRWTPVRNFARIFQNEILNSPSLRVMIHATLDKIELIGSVVSAITARSLHGHKIRIRAGKFILACGTIEIARILLEHSNRDGHKAPWAGNPWVGRGFTDHIVGVGGEVTVIDRGKFQQAFDNIYLGGYRYSPKIHLKGKYQIENRLVDIGAQFEFDSDYSAHLENIKLFLRSIREGGIPNNFAKLPEHILSVSAIALPLIARYLISHRSYKPNNSKAKLVFFSEQITAQESNISLSEKLDSFGHPLPIINWEFDGRELNSIGEFLNIIAHELEARGIAKIDVNEKLQRQDLAFFNNVYDNIHQMSTARMSETAQGGVVDQDLKVFGVDNLYIAGAAVFPTTGFSNPTFTAVALALRLADHLVATP